MRNVWLDIPLADYEAHMASPRVGQAQLLSDVFASSVAEYRPHALAMLGCAGGNGLERISAATNERVVGIDINPSYIEATRARFGGRFPRLDLFVGDVQTGSFEFDPVDLVFAGLLFEYVDVTKALAGIRSMLRVKGVLVAVLQMPSTTTADVTPSPCTTLTALSSVLHLVSPERFKGIAEGVGYRDVGADTVTAAGGKRFHVQALRLEAVVPPRG